MNHDPGGLMLWVEALFVAAPLVFAAIVIGVWWWQKKKYKGDV
jgi:uncharacterized membrane protein YhfC